MKYYPPKPSKITFLTSRRPSKGGNILSADPVFLSSREKRPVRAQILANMQVHFRLLVKIAANVVKFFQNQEKSSRFFYSRRIKVTSSEEGDIIATYPLKSLQNGPKI